jgi:O-antigen/teichoic acid export membrane protein
MRIPFLQMFKSKGIQQSVMILVGSFFASGLSAIALILITRQLGPQGFGEFSVGFAILLILNRLNDLGMTNVVQRYGAQEQDQDKISLIFSYATKVKFIGAVIICFIGIFFSPWIAQQLHFSQPIIIYLAFFLSVATTIYEHLQAMLQALHRFFYVALMNVLQSFAKTVGAVVLFVTASRASVPIFAWYMAVPALPLIFFSAIFPKWVKINIFKKFPAQHELAKNLAIHSSFSFVAAGIIENIDVLFVQHYLNTYEAGLLGGVSRVALLFSILAFALSSVLNPRVAKYKLKQDIESFLKKAFLLVGCTVIGFLLFLPLSKIILLLTIGQQYLAGVHVMNILVAASFLTVAVMPFIALFFSFNKNWYFSVSGLLQLTIIVVGNVGFVPIYGLEAAAWTRLTARLSLFVFTVVLALITYRQHYAKNHS